MRLGGGTAMTTRRLNSAFFVLLVFALMVSAPAWADSEVRIVRLSLVDGPVQLDRANGQGFERAIMNMPITNGMQLWTRENSRAEIEFEEGSSIRVTPGTKVEFTQLILRTDGTRTTVMTIGSGRAYVNYSRKSGEDFRIVAGNREIALNRSVHFRVDVVGDRAEIAVFSGELDAGPLRVKKNNTALLYLSGGNDGLTKGIAPAVEDRWDQYRSEYHDTYAKSNYNGSSFYGRSDLNYYGGWIDTGIGSCWRPYGFASSWDPYSSGAWALYPGYGYTFVSLYPWGWQPYRSGAWNYASGVGFCWTPSRSYYGLGWTPVYNAPSGYQAAQPPTQVTRVPSSRNPGTLGIIPVGNVNTTGNWKPTDTIILDRGNRGHRGETSGVVSSGASGGAGVAASTVVSGAAGTSSTRSSRGDRNLNAPPSPATPASAGPRPDRGDRALQRDMQREQQQIQREQRQAREGPREPRGFDRQPSAPFQSSPPPSAPQMSAPAPSAPAAAPAPARSSGGSRGAVPK